MPALSSLPIVAALDRLEVPPDRVGTLTVAGPVVLDVLGVGDVVPHESTIPSSASDRVASEFAPAISARLARTGRVLRLTGVPGGVYLRRARLERARRSRRAPGGRWRARTPGRRRPRQMTRRRHRRFRRRRTHRRGRPRVLRRPAGRGRSPDGPRRPAPAARVPGAVRLACATSAAFCASTGHDRDNGGPPGGTSDGARSTQGARGLWPGRCSASPCSVSAGRLAGGDR